MKSKSACRLIVASSERDANMLYANSGKGSALFVPDDFVYLELGAQKYAMHSPLEIARAQVQTRAEISIVELSSWRKRARVRFSLPKEKVVSLAKIIFSFVERKGFLAECFEVPRNFPLALADELRDLGLKVVAASSDIFFLERSCKKPHEIECIREALRCTESGLACARGILAEAEVRGSKLFWRGDILTSEILRAEIDSEVLRGGGEPRGTIVACGVQSADPHERGSGELRVGEFIIVDIFPRMKGSGFFGDLTRTFVKGRREDFSEKALRMYELLCRGQKEAIESLRAGVAGKGVEEQVRELFAKNGFPTRFDGKPSGFFHGLGHGLGLDLHEAPSLRDANLEAGQVFTVEPGLYYPNLGGARVEDVVLLRENDCEVLSKFSYELFV